MSLQYTICFCRYGELVLMLYRYRPPNQFHWNGLGGKLQEDETPQACVQREVLEEAEIDCRLTHKFAKTFWGDMRQKKKMARICVKFRLPFLSESSRKLFGREPLETQLLNPMALFLNLLAHFSRTWACFS